MFIVHHKDTFVRPHRHIGKSESMYIIEGEVDLILFHDNGSIKDVIEMGDFSSKKIIYHRLNQPIFHTLFIKSEYLVFHEVTEGPFDRSRTEFPDWAPINESTDIKHFIKNLQKTIDKKMIINKEEVIVKTQCRVCNTSEFDKILKLRDTPLEDQYLKRNIEQKTYPLTLLKCKNCDYIFLKEVVSPQISYSEYLYESKVTNGLDIHYDEYISNIIKKYKIPKKSLAVDLGSNDGLMLSLFKKQIDTSWGRASKRNSFKG